MSDVLNRWLASSEEDRQADFELLAAIVERSRDLAVEKWGARFTVLYWGMAEDIPERLEAAGIRVVRLRDVFGDGRWWEDFVIPGDGHPSPAGHQQIAQAALDALRIPGPSKSVTREDDETDPASSRAEAAQEAAKVLHTAASAGSARGGTRRARSATLRLRSALPSCASFLKYL